MNYYELRSELAKVIPRRTQLEHGVFGKGAVKEKGRKSNYYQFDLERREMLKNERLLNTEEINSFVEVSLRASACPMPLNIDTWDGLTCAYACRYCMPSGTKILMANGTEKNIGRICVGDRIMSFNPDAQVIESATVTEKMKRTAEELIALELENGKVVKMTPEHPVYTKRGWVNAGDLTEDDEVLTW